MSGLKDGMTRATAGFADTQAKVKEGMEKAMKTAEELMAFSQGNLEAMVKCGQIWAAGVQDIGKQIAANAQASFDETMSTFKALSSVKSLKDAFDLQASLARSTLEKTLAESGKLTDASMKLTEQALAPLTARVSLAMEKFAKTGLIGGRHGYADGNCRPLPRQALAAVEEGPGPCRGLFSCVTRELNVCAVNALLTRHRLPIWFVLRQAAGWGLRCRRIGQDRPELARMSRQMGAEER